MKAAHVNTEVKYEKSHPCNSANAGHGVSGSKWRGCNEWLGISTQTGKAKSTWSAKDYHLAKLSNSFFTKLFQNRKPQRDFCRSKLPRGMELRLRNSECDERCALDEMQS